MDSFQANNFLNYSLQKITIALEYFKRNLQTEDNNKQLCKLSNETLKQLSNTDLVSKMEPYESIRYLNTTCIHSHRYEKISTLTIDSPNKSRFQQKGLIFIWPQKRHLYYTKELIVITWFVTQTLYWLHVLNLFPNGTAVPLKEPPWQYQQIVRKPENRDYIIEPDWNSG